MLFKGIARSREEADRLRQQVQEHDLQVDLHIIQGVMTDYPWIHKVRMVSYQETFCSEFSDESGKVIDDFQETNPPGCALLNRGFRGYPLLKELLVEKTPEGLVFTTKDFKPRPDNRRSSIEDLVSKA